MNSPQLIKVILWIPCHFLEIYWLAQKFVGVFPWNVTKNPNELWGQPYSKYGEGSGTPFQYSCLENPVDGGAWWAAVHGVTQSWTRLKRLSISITIDKESHLMNPGGTSGKEPSCQCRRHKRHRFHPWVRKSPWRRWWQPTPVSLPGESHGQRSLVGYRPWGRKESDMTEVTWMHAI